MTNLSPKLWPAVQRGLFCRCPQCGKGKLYQSYLKPVNLCAVCSTSFKNIRADDGPAWLTILVVGHILVPLALHIFQATEWAVWQALTVLLSLAVLLVLALLPPMKGLFIGFMWWLRETKVG